MNNWTPQLPGSDVVSRLRGLATGELMLSAYVPLEVGQALRQGYEARLMDILRQARQGNTEQELAAFEPEAQQMLDYVRSDFKPSGRTLVLFSSKPRGLFEALTLQVPLPGAARLSPQPYLIPLETTVKEHPRLAIAVVDEREARFILASLGEVESLSSLHDPVPGRQHQGGWSAFKYERDRAHHVTEHLDHVARQLRELDRLVSFKRLVLGGQAETTHQLAERLDTQTRDKLAGIFRAEMFATDNELANQALKVAEAAERSDEVKLLDQIRERTYAAGNGALGWDETLQALREGRVQTLAIAGARLGHKDADEALTLAWQTGAEVEFLRGEADVAMQELGGMGALLRY